MSRPSVEEWRKAILLRFGDGEAVSDDWVPMPVMLPAEIADRLRREIGAA